MECAGGCDDHFAEVVNMTREGAYALACRLLRDPDEARDAVQEAYIRVWHHRRRFDGRVLFTTWLYRIVVNLCYDQLKSRRRRRRAMESLMQESAGDHQQGDTATDKPELLEKVMRACQELPPKQRMVFVLRDLQDLEMAEIAKITGLKMGAIKSNLYYARKALFRILKNSGSQDEVQAV
jgi:RNA polymerase sigma-70 factor (ECF subfamily)